MYFKDFSSGAMIENIVRRAKKLAIKRELAGGDRGIRIDDLIELDPPGVQGARGPAQHDQPRRLGEDLGQEGRAHRLRAHARPHRRGRRRDRRSFDRTGRHRPVPLATGDAPTAPDPDRALDRVAPWPSEDLRHRDRVRHRRARGRGVEPDHGLVAADQRLRLGVAWTNVRGADGTPRVGWDFEDESPGNDARGDALPVVPRARGRDPPRQRGAHQRRPLLRRPRPPRALDAGVLDARAGAPLRPGRRGDPPPLDGRRPARCSPTARRSSSTRTTPTARATATAATRTTCSTGPCRSAGSSPTPPRTSSPARSSPAPARSAPRRPGCAPTRCPSSSRSAPTSSRRRSGSRPR